MTMLAYDPVTAPPADVRCTDLQNSLRRSEVITLAPAGVQSSSGGPRTAPAPLTGAILVNRGCGGLIVDTDAMHAALHDGRLGGVGPDVFDTEPPTHHPLIDSQGVLDVLTV